MLEFRRRGDPPGSATQEVVFLSSWDEMPAVSVQQSFGTLVTPGHLCPDLLRHEQIGGADGWRGRVVRGFFWLMRLWPPA